MQIRSIDYAAPGARAELLESFRESGFAVLVNHPIPRALLDRLYDHWLKFFTDPRRLDYLFDADGDFGVQAGYVPAEVSETAVGQTQKDLKEFYNLMPGGRIPDDLQTDILDYRRRTYALGRELVGWIAEELPPEISEQLSEPLSEMVSDEESLLRVIHYPALPEDAEPNGERAASHEDINIVTILPASDQPGLQAQDLAGVWHDLASRKGDLILNAGDMLSEATAQYIPSTTHRVINPARPEDNVSRIAIPYFLGARSEVVLSDRYTAGSYRAERLHALNPEHH